MSPKTKVTRAVDYARDNGLFSLLYFICRLVYFRVYERKFKTSARVYFKNGFVISGRRYISLGRNFRAGYGLRVEAIDAYHDQSFTPSLRIGDDVFINDYVHIGCVHQVTIGSNVLMASKIFISDHNHGRYSGFDADGGSSPSVPPAERAIDYASVFIGDNVWLGEFVSVLPGSSIGAGSVIGANSVVNGSIPPFSVAVGSPARVIKTYDFQARQWLSVSASSEDAIG